MSGFGGSSKRGINHAHMNGSAQDVQGDPGQYNPYAHEDMAYRVAFTHNRTRKPFGIDSARFSRTHDPLGVGNGVPGVGTYRAATAQRKMVFPDEHGNRFLFKSGVAQRPDAKTLPPGPNTYSPNMASVESNVPDSGTLMRGVLPRFTRMEHPNHFMGDPGETSEAVGPGRYTDEHDTVGSQAQNNLKRSSRRRSSDFGFGSSTKQRALGPFDKNPRDNSPGPGSYQSEGWYQVLAAENRSGRKSPRSRPSTTGPGVFDRLSPSKFARAQAAAAASAAGLGDGVAVTPSTGDDVAVTPSTGDGVAETPSTPSHGGEAGVTEVLPNLDPTTASTNIVEGGA